MATKKLNLTRDQLATFLKDHEQIKQFESLFATVDAIAPDFVNEVALSAGNAQATANDALALIEALENSLTSDGAVVDAKSTLALDEIAAIKAELQLKALEPAQQHNNALTTDYLTINQNGHAESAVGRMLWDDGEGTVDLGLKGGNVTVKIGQQEYARAYNDTASTMTKGQVVYISGAQGNRVAVKLAQADSDANSAHTIGLVAETIAAGSEGWVQVSGAMYKLNTLAATAGDTVYLSPTTAGTWTTTKPVAPNHLVIIGFVERVSATVGSVFIKVDNGYELEELHNVRITSVSNGDVLQYDSAGPYWKNIPVSSLPGGPASNLVGGTTGSLPYQSAASTTTFLSIGTAGQVLQVNAGATAPQWVNVTGTGDVVRATSPTLISPALGVPVSGDFSSGTFTWPTFNQNTTGQAGSVANAVTFNNSGAGAASGTTFNGSAARTISYNTIGAQPAGTYVTSVTGTAPVVSSGGTTPAISMAAATGSVNGYLTSTDWTTFNGKQAALVSGTNIKTVGGASLLGSGDVGIIGPTYGGTGVNNGTRTLTVNTNSGTLSFTNASTTLTIANTGEISGTNTGDQTITLTGDVTGSGTGSFATTIAAASTGTGNLVRATSPTIATPTITTSATVPLVIGGTGTTSTLTLRATSGVGTTGSDIIFQVGNNGATEAMRVISTGWLGVNTNAPDAPLSVNGVASFGDGTEGAPSIANFGDLDTGIWFPATNTMAISTGGVERFQINSIGTVFIGNGSTDIAPSDGLLTGTGGSGTNIVGASLTVQAGRGTGTAAGGSVIFSTAQAGAISGTTLNAATERMRITPTGSVGIGTTNPGGTLEVSNEATAINLVVRGSSGIASGIVGRSSRGTLSAPTATLAGDNLSYWGAGGYNSTTGFTSAKAQIIGQAAENFTSAAQGTDLIISTTNIGTVLATEKVRVTSEGAMNVAGRICSTTTNYPNFAYNSAYRICFGETVPPPNDTTNSFVCYGSTDPARGMAFAITRTGAHTSFFGDDGGNMILGAESTGPIIFKQNLNYNAVDVLASGTEQMRIDSTGNVGIGTAAPATLLDVAGVVSANGVKFPAVQVASADANTLDDYEEGTFTPTIVGGTTAGTGTYTIQVGRYTKVGRNVTFTLYVNWTAHTGTGVPRVSGLPFTSANVTNSMASVSIGYFNNFTLTAATVPMAYVQPNTNQIYIWQMPSGGGAMTNPAFDIAAGIMMSGTYTV